MTIYDYDDIAHLPYTDVMAMIRKANCACISFSDAHACARFRGQRDYDLEIELFGDAQPCECTCHDIWNAWVHDDYE